MQIGASTRSERRRRLVVVASAVVAVAVGSVAGQPVVACDAYA